jgi:hypothetical protein
MIFYETALFILGRGQSVAVATEAGSPPQCLQSTDISLERAHVSFRKIPSWPILISIAQLQTDRRLVRTGGGAWACGRAGRRCTMRCYGIPTID